MLVYHGSTHNFKTLRIRKDLTRNTTKENEGYGIYFSLDKSVACSYGKYVYTIRVNDEYFVDMRHLRNCQAYVRKVRKDFFNRFRIPLELYVDCSMVAKYLQFGGVAISGVGSEIRNILLSNEEFYARYSKIVDTVCDWLLKYDGAPFVYMFTYHIKDCGIIRDVSPEIATIVKKEIIYGG